MKKKTLFACAALALVLAGTGLVLDSRFGLRVTEYNLYFDSLPAQFEGFCIVQLSDLHGSSFGRDNSRLAALVREQEPDLIALTGDFVEDESQLPATRGLLNGISGCAPIYWVNGNHEWVKGVLPALGELLDAYGVIRLENRYLPVSRDGAQIIVAGAEDPNGRADMIKPDALAEMLREEYPEEFVLWLGHRNYWAAKYPELPVDLILSGHAHGGIVRMPGIGGLLNVNHSFGAEYESGVYQGEIFKMVVSRGLGNSIPVPRFLNRPEVVKIILHCGQS